MSQVSHVHLAFVHGVCVRGSESESRARRTHRPPSGAVPGAGFWGC